MALEYAGVNPLDVYIRTGTHSVKPPLPYTPGSDGAGVVVAAGGDVHHVKVSAWGTVWQSARCLRCLTAA